MPTSDLSRMSMAKELPMSVSRVPATLPHLGTWLEDYIHKLDFGNTWCNARIKSILHSCQGHYGDRCLKG
eukprot:10212919-Prorocentrum_lima.AAC.1